MGSALAGKRQTSRYRQPKLPTHDFPHRHLDRAGAILLWSTLAFFTVQSGRVPPFQLVAMNLCHRRQLHLAVAAIRGRLHLARPTPASLALGIIGPFGDTALYFAALKLSPPGRSEPDPLSLAIADRDLRRLPAGWTAVAAPSHRRAAGAGGHRHAGARTAPKADRSGRTPALGYVLAGLGAVVWASYSVLSRRFAAVPTESVGTATLACTIPALACHLAFETTVWPLTATEWIGTAGLGLGSIGLAFLVWTSA